MENILDFFNKNKLITFLILILIILLFAVIIVFQKEEKVNKIDEYKLELFGSHEITIHEGEKYIEQGYVAYIKNKLVTNLVTVSGDVNTNKPGVYIITYTIHDKTLTRKIIVLEKDLDITFELIDEDITINKGEEFIDPGFIALDQDRNDYSNYVEVDNLVNVDEIGTYFVIYKIEYKDYIKELKRKVEVVEPLRLEIFYDESTYKKEIDINIKVTGENFNYLKLPNQVIEKEKETTYKIKENGSYIFYLYDTNGNFQKEIININNIDREIDSASCILNIKVKSSNIKINANDLSGIKYYKFNGATYSNDLIDLNYKLNSASVTVYDNAGNSKVINCSSNIEESIYGFILIGDSRFVGMETHLGKNKRSNDTFVAKGAMGWNWFKDTAIKKVNDILKKNPNRKYYIMCNLGINDYKYHFDDANYAKKLSSLANNEWKDHIVGYISVNPFASTKDSRNKKVETFNERQKGDMNGIYYCDTYNGIGLSNFKPRKSSDTTHYNKETSIKIYNYIINNCSF